MKRGFKKVTKRNPDLSGLIKNIDNYVSDLEKNNDDIENILKYLSTKKLETSEEQAIQEIVGKALDLSSTLHKALGD